MRAHQSSSDQMKILMAHKAHTTTTAMGIEYRLWLGYAFQQSVKIALYIQYIYIYIYIYIYVGVILGYISIIYIYIYYILSIK